MFKSVLIFLTFFFLSIALIFLGCGKGNFEPLPAGTNGMFYAVGEGESRNRGLARQMATQRARAAIAQVAQAHVTALSKDFQEQLGAGATGQINAVFSQVSESLADQRLKGCSDIDRKEIEENGLWTVQIMLGLPIKDNIENPLIAEISQDEALYQEFQAWKGHNDLAKKIKELREQ